MARSSMSKRAGGGKAAPKPMKGSRPSGSGGRFSKPGAGKTNPKSSKGSRPSGGKGGAFGANPGKAGKGRPMVKGK